MRKRGRSAVLCLRGDGTVNEVANGIIGFDNAAMTVIPVGTGNDFLKNFGTDMEKFKDAENLWNGPQFPMDAIDVNGRIALTIACSGLDARWPEMCTNTVKVPSWTEKAATSCPCWLIFCSRYCLPLDADNGRRRAGGRLFLISCATDGIGGYRRE